MADLFGKRPWGVIALLCAAAAPAFSTALLQLSMERMAASGTEIVQGTVTGSHTALDGGTIFTHYSVQVSQRWKGPENPVTDVAIPGGSFGQMRQSFPGVPVLEVGKQYVLFLWQGKHGPKQPVGLNQGVLEVSSPASGPLMVTRRAIGETMVSREGRPVVDQPVQMRLADLHARIKAVLIGTPRSAQ